MIKPKNKSREKTLLLDVSKCLCTPEGYYILSVPGGECTVPYHQEADYRDLVLDRPVWSIGRRRNDGVILASHTAIFYGHPHFECIWLR